MTLLDADSKDQSRDPGRRDNVEKRLLLHIFVRFYL